jgi:hypothetical protein
LTPGDATFWFTGSFAPLWFADARKETSSVNDSHARRREIVFSVAAAETFLLEWVRDDVLMRDFRNLDSYFPPGEWSRITDRWKDIPNKLKASGLIKSVPNFGGNTWADFLRLVKFRNGLLHAGASRPETAGLTKQQLPVPSMSELDALRPGSAVDVVARLISELTSAAGTAPPPWLKTP